jgi:hypothetical protein
MLFYFLFLLSIVARKRKEKRGPVEVYTFKASGVYPYYKTVLSTMGTFIVLFTFLIIRLFSIFYILVFLIIAIVLILIFALSPALTAHHLGGRALRLRHGWYFRCKIPLTNIRDVEETEEGVPGHGVSFLLGGFRLYLTNSRVGLVKILLHDKQRMGGVFGRNISEIILNVDDPDRFIRTLRKRAGLKPLPERRPGTCPKCGQPTEDEAERPERREFVTPEVHMIECIFLIHNDGRLITSYKSGRVKTKEAFSVTGMLTVIQDFVNDAFKRTEGSLKTLEHGDLKILIERGAHVYLAVIIEGSEPGELRKEMRRVLKEVDREYGDILDEDWDGELTELKHLKKILAQVMWL